MSHGVSQCDQILRHMKRGWITPIQALEQYGCFRLAARVSDLRHRGHNIQTEMVEKDDKRFARYRLVR